MPKHKLHVEYCRLAGLNNLQAVQSVNTMIDFPSYHYGYRTFRETLGYPLPIYGWKHNMARRQPEDAELEVQYLTLRNKTFRTAYFLHHLLDLYSEHNRSGNKSVSECRSWARDKMKLIFGNHRPGRNLLLYYNLRRDYLAAETFFISPKSQFWLERLPQKRAKLRAQWP